MKTAFRILCAASSLVICLSLLSLAGGAVSVSSLRWPLFPNGYLYDSQYDYTVSSPPNQWTTGILSYQGSWPGHGYSYGLPGFVNIDAVYDPVGSSWTNGPQIKYIIELGQFGLNYVGPYWIMILLPSYIVDFDVGFNWTVLDSHVTDSFPGSPTLTFMGEFSRTFDSYDVQIPSLNYLRKDPDRYQPYYSTVKGSYTWAAYEIQVNVETGYVSTHESDVVFVIELNLDHEVVVGDGGPDLAYPDLESDTWDNLLLGFFSSFKPIFDNPYFNTLGLLFAVGFGAAAFTKLLL